MELFGYLTFVGDVQTIPTQGSNPQYGNEPFIVREIAVHTFVPSLSNGEVVPFMRGLALRLTGRMAQTFDMMPGELVCAELGMNCRPYTDQRDQKRRVNGALTVSRICRVLDSDLNNVQRIIAQYQNT